MQQYTAKFDQTPVRYTSVQGELKYNVLFVGKLDTWHFRTRHQVHGGTPRIENWLVKEDFAEENLDKLQQKVLALQY